MNSTTGNIGAACLLAALALPMPVWAQGVAVRPVFDIWSVELGKSVALLPEQATAIIACGTNGGPPSLPLSRFDDYMLCSPEPSGLREVSFTYDDEQDYIAKALESEFEFVQGGTSVFAHPVIVSVLVDPQGIASGIRIVTDDRVSDRVRRMAVTLARNFKARFGGWSLQCEDIPPRPGENPVGSQFIHEVCQGQDPETGTRLRMEASYLRKRGQEGINRETQQVNTGYFESVTRLDLVQPPYEPEAVGR